jgi:hypothetical protein
MKNDKKKNWKKPELKKLSGRKTEGGAIPLPNTEGGFYYKTTS